jgi:hypothetical protein
LPRRPSSRPACSWPALRRHTFLAAGSAKRRSEPLTQPDDMTRIGRDLFTGFQNGVGPQGQASTDGNRDSTIVEFSPEPQGMIFVA